MPKGPLRGQVHLPGKLERAAHAAARAVERVLVRGRGPRGPKITSDLGVEEWLDGGLWADGDSSNVAALRYDLKNRHLFVEFDPDGGRGPSTYVYSGVPLPVAKDFFMAPSLGRFVWRRLRGKFAYSRVS